MTDDEKRPEDEEDSTPAEDLPPPSTWAGRSRREPDDQKESFGRGLTEEFDGLEAELSADIGDLSSDADEGISAADEQEEPPDEFAFDEASEDEDSLEDDDELAAASAEPENDSSMTIEADTLSLADVEEAKEKAHAGLSARAERSSFSHDRTTGSHRIQPPPAAAVVPMAATEDPDEAGAGKPPKRRMWWRFAAASLVIVSAMAAATAVSFLLFLSDIAEGLNDKNIDAVRQELSNVEGGDPQTVLVLGSDKRNGTPGDPGRSDTAILLRVDPDKGFLSLMSLPRDLEVPIPGYGVDKLNAAYSYGEEANSGGGGTELAVKTIKDYLDIPINHVVNVDFEGFYEAVNAIDCVYIDVDREYFNSNEGVFGDALYAEIDVPAGYSKLCGYTALQYVRYRHEDNDLVRGARQQDFIREARQRIPPRQLLPVFGEGDELIDIFTKNTSSDIDDVPTIIEMLKTFVEVRDAPVRQVSIGEITNDGGVEASKDQIASAVAQFLGDDLDEEPEGSQPPESGNEDGKKGGKSGEPKPDEPSTEAKAAGLIDSSDTGAQYGSTYRDFMKRKKADLPIYYPTQIVSNSAAQISDDSRAAALAGPDDKNVYYMYKFVMPFQEAGYLSYYGLSGVNWRDAPILNNPSEVRTIDGRDYLLFYEQDRLRLVGWKSNKGSYWVSNTLTHTLTEEQMLGVATSAKELGD